MSAQAAWLATLPPNDLALFVDGTDVVLGGGCRDDVVGELGRRLATIMRRANATVVMSAELGAFDAGADELPAPPRWARDTCPQFFDDEFWRTRLDCNSDFWLGECADPPRLRYANTGVFGGVAADLLRMTQTALTSDLLHARPRRHVAPRARLLRRAREERVPPRAVGAPQGRLKFPPRRRLGGVSCPLQRPLEALLAGGVG